MQRSESFHRDHKECGFFFPTYTRGRCVQKNLRVINCNGFNTFRFYNLEYVYNMCCVCARLMSEGMLQLRTRVRKIV